MMLKYITSTVKPKDLCPQFGATFSMFRTRIEVGMVAIL